MRRVRLTAALALSALAASALAVTALGGTAATTVSVTAGKPTELKFTLSKTAVKKGVVVFKVANKGMISHDFKIAGKETPSLASGKSSTLKVTFKKAGKYPFLCTLPGHAAGGMKGVLVVR